MAFTESLGSLVVDIQGRVTGLANALNEAGSKIETFSSRATTNLDRTSKRFRRAAFGMAIEFTVMAMAMKSFLKMGVEWEDQLALISTVLTEDMSKGLHEVSTYLVEYDKRMQELMVTYGQSAKTVTKATYDLLSSEVPAAEAMDILNGAMRASVAGFTTVDIATMALIKTLKGYGMATSEVNHVNDVMFAMVKKGLGYYADFAGVVGDTASLTRFAGMRFEEEAAALALLSLVLGSAEKASTAYKAILIKLLVPEKAAVDVGKKYGLNLKENVLRTHGLIGVVEKLRYANEKDIATMFRRSQSMVGMMTLLTNLTKFYDMYDAMLGSVGETETAFAKQSQAPGFALKQLVATSQVLAIQFARTLNPTLKDTALALMTVERGLLWLPKETMTFWTKTIGVFVLFTGAVLVGSFAVSMFSRAFASLLGSLKPIANLITGKGLTGALLTGRGVVLGWVFVIFIAISAILTLKGKLQELDDTLLTSGAGWREFGLQMIDTWNWMHGGMSLGAAALERRMERMRLGMNRTAEDTKKGAAEAKARLVELLRAYGYSEEQIQHMLEMGEDLGASDTKHIQEVQKFVENLTIELAGDYDKLRLIRDRDLKEYGDNAEAVKLINQRYAKDVGELMQKELETFNEQVEGYEDALVGYYRKTQMSTHEMDLTYYAKRLDALRSNGKEYTAEFVRFQTEFLGVVEEWDSSWIENHKKALKQILQLTEEAYRELLKKVKENEEKKAESAKTSMYTGTPMSPFFALEPMIPEAYAAERALDAVGDSLRDLGIAGIFATDALQPITRALRNFMSSGDWMSETILKGGKALTSGMNMFITGFIGGVAGVMVDSLMKTFGVGNEAWSKAIERQTQALEALKQSLDAARNAIESMTMTELTGSAKSLQKYVDEMSAAKESGRTIVYGKRYNKETGKWEEPNVLGVPIKMENLESLKELLKWLNEAIVGYGSLDVMNVSEQLSALQQQFDLFDIHDPATQLAKIVEHFKKMLGIELPQNIDDLQQYIEDLYNALRGGTLLTDPRWAAWQAMSPDEILTSLVELKKLLDAIREQNGTYNENAIESQGFTISRMITEAQGNAVIDWLSTIAFHTRGVFDILRGNYEGVPGWAAGGSRGVNVTIGDIIVAVNVDSVATKEAATDAATTIGQSIKDQLRSSGVSIYAS